MSGGFRRKSDWAIAEASVVGIHRRREIDWLLAATAIAKEAGLSSTYLYGLAGGTSQDPSVRILVRLARAIQVSPLLLFRYYADLGGAPLFGAPLASTNRAVGLGDPSDIAVFNADVTTPDHAIVLPGEAFHKIWEIQNVGRRSVSVWPSHHKSASLEWGEDWLRFLPP